MNNSDQILLSLVELCKENEIIPTDASVNDDDDLFEYGVIDSMGLTILTFVIEEHFGLQVLPELLVAELRTPKSIAEYIAQHGFTNATAI
jgi:acyl carrier protein